MAHDTNNPVDAPVEIVGDQRVCVDCMVFIANGDLPEDADAAAAIIAGCEREAAAGGHWAMDCPEDCEGAFSWSACDCCGSTLGGDRHPAAVVYRKEPSDG